MIGYEPVKIFDSVSVPWNNVVDMNITKDQLIACSIQQSHFSVWVVNITVISLLFIFISKKLKPFNSEVFTSSLEQESIPKIVTESAPVPRHSQDPKPPKNIGMILIE